MRRAGRLAGVVDCWAAGRARRDPTSTPAGTSLPRRRSGSPTPSAAAPTVRPLPMLLVAARAPIESARRRRRRPGAAFSVGAARVIPQEHPGFRLTHVDVDDHPDVPDLLLAELTHARARARASRSATADGSSAPTDRHRSPTAEDSHGLPERPVVMVTGGLGHMGITLGESLFARDRRPPGPGRPVDVARSRTSGLERAEDPSFDEHERQILRRLAAMHERARRRPRAHTPTSATRRRSRAAVDAACRAVRRDRHRRPRRGERQPAAFGPVAETGRSVDRQPDLAQAARAGAPDRRRCAAASPPGGCCTRRSRRCSAASACPRTRAPTRCSTRIATPGGPTWLSIDWDAWDNAAEAQMAGMPTAIHPRRARMRSSGLLRAPSRVAGRRRGRRPRRPARVLGPRGPTAAKPVGGRRPPSPPEPRHAVRRARVPTRRRAPRRDLGLPARARQGRRPRPLLRPGRPLAARGAGGVGDPRPLPDRDAGAPAVQGADHPRAGGAGRAGRAHGRRRRLDRATSPSRPRPPTRRRCDRPVASRPGPGDAAKASYREFYDDVSRRLAATGMGEASFFLNYGYVSQGDGDEAAIEVPDDVPNRNSIRLALELVGDTDLERASMLDVGCGRGGTVVAPRRAVRRRGRRRRPVTGSRSRSAATRTARPATRFEVGDAEHLPFDDALVRRRHQPRVVAHLPRHARVPRPRSGGSCDRAGGSSTPTCWPASAGWK